MEKPLSREDEGVTETPVVPSSDELLTKIAQALTSDIRDDLAAAGELTWDLDDVVEEQAQSLTWVVADGPKVVCAYRITIQDVTEERAIAAWLAIPSG